MSNITQIDITDCVSRIVCLNKGLSQFWGNSKGWAPIEAAELLSKSRLDWQVSLSLSLNRWTSENIAEDDFGSLILAWANLGSLVEGTLKLFLSVYYRDYKDDVDAIKKFGQFTNPDELVLDGLRIFFAKKIWDRDCDYDWNSWVLYVQQKRNAVHAFKDRDLGTYEDFLSCTRRYLELLRFINDRLPYPEDYYSPCETIIGRSYFK